MENIEVALAKLRGSKARFSKELANSTALASVLAKAEKTLRAFPGLASAKSYEVWLIERNTILLAVDEAKNGIGTEISAQTT